MATYVEDRGRVGDAEPVGLLTEGAAGIAVIVLAVIALAGVSVGTLASIAAIVIGVGLMVQAFNSAAEHYTILTADTAAARHTADLGGEVLVDGLCGITGIVLGVLALVGPGPLLSAALIIFGGGLLVGGASSIRPRAALLSTDLATSSQTVTYRHSAAASGMGALIGLAAIVLGILSLLLIQASILVPVGFLAVGAALLVASAGFSGAVLRLFTTS